MRIIKKIYLNKSFMIFIDLCLILMFILAMLYTLSWYSKIFYLINIFFSGILIIWIVYIDLNPAYKIAWIVLIALMPIFGGFLYLRFSGNQLSSKERSRMKTIEVKTKELLPKNQVIEAEMKLKDVVGFQQIKYIQNYGPYPVYRNSGMEFYPTGEICFEKMKIALNTAEKFIFIEYYIIEEGRMWGEVLEILKRKVQDGVDVRVVYDAFGCMFKLPENYHKILRGYGIKCEVFNPLKPVISSKFNVRNHRKIMVIDGHTAFTGGLNLADEYINENEKFGHWKDMGLMVKGQSVWSFTVMFLTLWDYLSQSETDFDSFRVSYEIAEEQGLVLPYSDNPLDGETVAVNVYLNMINKAENYIYITTPYLIISSEMLKALCNAAKNGVDVRIITPHKPDKWYVHTVSRSYYKKLISNGVTILEYEPGFMHGKNFVVDDKYAVIGTINMDFRSLYLHFECGVWMTNTRTVLEVKKDFEVTQGKCIKMTLGNIKEARGLQLICSCLLRIFAPLM